MADTVEQSTAGEPESGFDLADARRCVGTRVEEVAGGSVGRVQGVLVDADDGSPTWLIVKLGRIGRRSAVPARFVVAADDKAWAAFPRSWIRGAAEIDPSGGLTPLQERQLCAHYGIPLDSGRPARLTGRVQDELSSLPDS
jgi:PRC-barrel domain